MRTTAVFILVITALVVVASAAAKNAAVGTWDCKSVDEKGTEHSWTMVVKQEQGKLAGYIEGTEPSDQIPLVEPTLDGQTFSFKIVINPEETVTVTLKLEGDTLEGKFAGKASGTGTFNGKRRA